MSDIADRAQDHMEREEALVLAAGRKPPGPARDGHCLNCGAAVEHLFCDSDCRLDYEARTSLGERLHRRD